MEEIKKALEKSKAILGNKQTIKYLKKNDIRLVIIASNCPDKTKKDLEHYATFNKIEIKKFNGTGKQLGVFCGKPFPISTIGIKK